MPARSHLCLVLLSSCLAAAACGETQRGAPPVQEEWGHAHGQVTTVLDDGDLLALSDARVEVYRLDPARLYLHGDVPDGPPSATVYTDANGRFSVRSPAGWATLRFVAPDHTETHRTLHFRGDGAGVFDVDLHPQGAPQAAMREATDPDMLVSVNAVGLSYPTDLAY